MILKIKPSISAAALKYVESGEAEQDNLGLCIECGDEAYGVEPDAREYRCESCGCDSVYGCEEILVMSIGL